MKKANTSSLFFSLLLVSGLFILSFSAFNQESSKESPLFPEIHPEKISTWEQIDIIKKWTESFDTGAIK